MSKAKTTLPVTGCVCAINRFKGLSEPKEISTESSTALNEWGARLTSSSQVSQRQKKKVRAIKSEDTQSSNDEPSKTIEAIRSQYPRPGAGDAMEPRPAPQDEAPIIVRSETNPTKLA